MALIKDGLGGVCRDLYFIDDDVSILGVMGLLALIKDSLGGFAWTFILLMMTLLFGVGWDYWP